MEELERALGRKATV